MGIVTKKAEHAGDKVTFDFAGPDVFVPAAERAGLRTRDDEASILLQASGLLGPDDQKIAESLRALASKKFGAEAPDTINFHARAVKFLIRSAAQAVYPKPEAITRKERAGYAAWQRHLDFDGPDEITITLGRVIWLTELLDRDVIGLPLESSQWIEAVLEYCEAVIDRTLAAITTRETTDS